MRETFGGPIRVLRLSAAALAAMSVGIGCGHRAHRPAAAAPLTPQAQQTQQQFLQNNPAIPPAEQAALQKQTQRAPGTH